MLTINAMAMRIMMSRLSVMPLDSSFTVPGTFAACTRTGGVFVLLISLAMSFNDFFSSIDLGNFENSNPIYQEMLVIIHRGTRGKSAHGANRRNRHFAATVTPTTKCDASLDASF